jgi:hypothetical protein
MAAIPAFATVAETGETSPEATAHVLDFLQRYPMVARLLEKAEGPLRAAFGPDVTLTLAVEADPEIPSWEYLVAGIQTARSAKEAHACLQAFDDAWWLAQASRAQDKLLFDLLAL